MIYRLDQIGFGRNILSTAKLIGFHIISSDAQIIRKIKGYTIGKQIFAQGYILIHKLIKK